jgi:hypothetical protein
MENNENDSNSKMHSSVRFPNIYMKVFKTLFQVIYTNKKEHTAHSIQGKCKTLNFHLKKNCKRSLSYLTEVQYTELSERDNALQSALNNKNYAEALECSQKEWHNFSHISIQTKPTKIKFVTSGALWFQVGINTALYCPLTFRLEGYS